MSQPTLTNDNSTALYNTALRLSIYTIVYNIAEGLVATYLGYRDESLSLFGFGVDSFIEVISGLGIAHMVLRVSISPNGDRDGFERTALAITGTSFYVLAVGLSATGMYNAVTGQQPRATISGVVIALISIGVMLVLIHNKRKVGRALNSPAIIADAECTKVCVFMSIVLLAASGMYAMTNIGYVDILGSLALAYLSFREGRECFQKARGSKDCSCEPE